MYLVHHQFVCNDWSARLSLRETAAIIKIRCAIEPPTTICVIMWLSQSCTWSLRIIKSNLEQHLLDYKQTKWKSNMYLSDWIFKLFLRCNQMIPRRRMIHSFPFNSLEYLPNQTIHLIAIKCFQCLSDLVMSECDRSDVYAILHRYRQTNVDYFQQMDKLSFILTCIYEEIHSIVLFLYYESWRF